MRKLLWCCSAAGVLAAGAMMSLSFYAGCHPDTAVGRCVTTVTGSSVLARPVASIATVMVRATQHLLNEPATVTTPGSIEECVPEEPRPVAVELPPEPVELGIIERPGHDPRGDAVAPIVIHEEDETVPPAEEAVPSTIDIAGMEESKPADAACPMVMPYCVDDDEPAPATPNMPYAEADEKKPADGSEGSEDGAFRAWLKLFEGTGHEEQEAAEELPAPTEDVTAEPKCQEDCHRHENYSGCPRVTCPYTGKTYPAYDPPAKPGKEEANEEPAPRPINHKKHGKGAKSCPHCTEGVDTMEYRPSDGGLNEYGPGPL